MTSHTQRLALCLLMVWIGLPGVASAQPPAQAPAPATTVVQSSKSIWPGVAVTVIACGLGLFAVVKSSARN